MRGPESETQPSRTGQSLTLLMEQEFVMPSLTAATLTTVKTTQTVMASTDSAMAYVHGRRRP